MPPRKTPIAAREIGISQGHLHYLIRATKVSPPGRDTSGDYLWTDADIERAREALKIDRRRKAVVA
jgi:hypothetical protein